MNRQSLPADAPINKALLAALARLDQADRATFWHAQTPERRLEAVKLLRQIEYNYDPVTARMVKIFDTVSLDEF